MRNVDKDKLGIALKSANEEVRSFFLGNMSSRAGKMLLDDMGAMGPVRLRDVDEAQALLVNLAKDLAAKGEITLTKNRADDELAGPMAAPAKFLFDMDFSEPDRSRERAATPSEIAEKIAAAEARAYRSGYDTAQRDAKAESDRRAALALEEIAIGVKGIAARYAGIETRMETEAVDVAVAVARTLCSAP